MEDWGKILMNEYDINEEQAATAVSLILPCLKGLKGRFLN